MLKRKIRKIQNYWFKKDFKYLNKKIYIQLLMHKKATENIFNKKKLPFRSINVNNRSEEAIGELFTFFILETILLGKLMKINLMTSQRLN